jgi:hypothetical protein
MKKSLYSVILIFMLFAVSSVYSQGVLKGVVSDSTTNETLVGGNVFLLNTALGSATNLEGEYRINRIPAGN